MKLKRLPEDFQVEELTEFTNAGGSFAWYRLSKRGMGTPEVIEEILRRLRIPRDRVSYGGLKDRHALTTQYVTIFQGPRRDLKENAFELIYQGQSNRPFTPHDISGNRFHITLRSLREADAQQIALLLPALQREGVPNYFDDQRFGSVGYSGEFVAHPWCQGNWERTIWLALADPNEHDRPEDRDEKKILRDNWGDWLTCKRLLKQSNRRSIVTFLADRPDDYRGAIARLRVDLRGLYLAAFQSALWNQLLASWIRQECAAEQLTDVSLKLGPVPFFQSLNSELRERMHAVTLPLPSARIKLEESPFATLMDQVLKSFNLELREIRVKYPRDSFFSKGDRRAITPVTKLSHRILPDELATGRFKVELSFELPRGSYATILVKRLTAVPGVAESLPLTDADDL